MIGVPLCPEDTAGTESREAFINSHPTLHCHRSCRLYTWGRT
ncbi:unnamed protein product [Staurois parvus]|uniref:Uncharacterized protein n=1 Tax=Staurois parvus TaxID=386267 RepID=A0ABN9HNI3_9NEOB|nr:unnamed protein product [Staurois parvus]